MYRHEKMSQNCIWWHKQYRHWWLGDCRKKGLNHGYAWLEPDLACPTDPPPGGEGEGKPLWRRGGTDEALPLVGVKRSYAIPVLQFGTPDDERAPGFYAHKNFTKKCHLFTPLAVLLHSFYSSHLAVFTLVVLVSLCKACSAVPEC